MLDVSVTSTLLVAATPPAETSPPGSRKDQSNGAIRNYSLATDLAVNGRLAFGASVLWTIVLCFIVASIIGWSILYSRINKVQRELQAQNQLLELKLRYLLCRHEMQDENMDCDNLYEWTTTTATSDNPISRSKRDLVYQSADSVEKSNDSMIRLNMSSNTSPSKINDTKNFRRSIRGKLLKTEKKVGALKRVLHAEQRRARIAYSNFNQRLSTSGPRAAYIVVNGPEINIKTKGQLLGPWYIAKNGSELGFSDLDFWYGQHLSVNYNATSIIFQESGLFLIYAQVYYHITPSIGERPKPMGFRITVKKNEINTSKIKRPIPIAECVPSHPTSAYQTCFTQTAWYIGRGDELYLEHFMPGLPMVECEKQGQTFLGIVKL